MKTVFVIKKEVIQSQIILLENFWDMFWEK